MRTLSVLGCAFVLAIGACGSPGDDTEPVSDSSAQLSADSADAAARKPLRGKRIVLDPGHQLGNARFPDKINRPVPAGGFKKPCNTTGTSTNGGYAEATFTWRVSRLLAHKLRRLGAKVRLTRHSNRLDRWGPCVNVRGRAGNKWRAQLKVSVHADGASASGRGFHVIAPTRRKPWTADIYRPSKRLAKATRHGLHKRHFPVSNYAGSHGLDFRSDLGTLNLSDVPTVMVELGNMRNRRDARTMTSGKGRHRYARALLTGVRTYLHR
ncbi:N-acetylmuramoyl-L-alanine amidase [Solicola gregarius]|uniref:N-acetylmuramoyl-L-alanine amidase n=1 Tax=Solicola gregarius TaxID=2908642 RepID=A0AA46TK30_9ACTN|nr:N-acetylmuramoyl-L-alanine amidase [Solicola gregarius]UYM06772.1 N-acetylmuramoyl-L-alanine amidase [Solicola gregarius]